MYLLDYADVIGNELEIRFYPCRKPSFTASFDGAYTKTGNMLIGTYGQGNTPDEALSNYAQKLKGQTLIINCFHEKLRTEFFCPEDLTY